MSQVDDVAQTVPTMIERGRQLAEQWVPLTGWPRRVAPPALGEREQRQQQQQWQLRVSSLPLAVVSSAFEAVLVVFLSLYWLVSMPTLRAFLLSLIPPDARRADARGPGGDRPDDGRLRPRRPDRGDADREIVFLGLWIIGVQYPLALAVLAGIGEFMPYVGPILAAAPAVLLALLESPTHALIVLGFYAVLQLVEGYLLFPLVVGNQSEIPPLLIILGLLAGGAVGGVLGALVAIPLAGALRIIILRVVAPAIRRRTGGIERSPEGRGATDWSRRRQAYVEGRPRRSARPASVVFWTFWSTTTLPLTITYSMPTGNCFGSARVDIALTVFGLNTTMSALKPSRSSPRSGIPRRWAGNEVILRIAFGSER